MKRAILIVISIGVCGAMILAVTKQRDQLAELKSEQAQVLARLAAPVEAPLSVAPANDPSSRQTSYSPSLELLQLRAEVARLGNRKRELANVPAERAQLQRQNVTGETNAPGVFTLPAGYIKRSAAKFLGYNTPEETIQSFLWAVQNRDAAKFLEVFDPRRAKEFEDQFKSRESIEEFFKEAAFFPGMNIVGKEAVAEGEIVVTVEIMPGGEPKQQIRFKQIGGQWKMVSGF